MLARFQRIGHAKLYSRLYSASSVSKALESSKLKPGDVVIQNDADSEVGKEVIKLAKDKGLKTVNVIADKPGTAEIIENLKALGGDIVFTEAYTRTWYVKRLLSDVPPPKVAISHATGSQLTSVAQLLSEGGTLFSNSKLPENVEYPGATKKPVSWSTYLKSRKLSAKTL